MAVSRHVKVARSVLSIGALVAGISLVGSQALLQDTATAQNSTFTTGNTALKLFYDCWLDQNGSWVQQATSTFTTSSVLGLGDVGAIVACPGNAHLADANSEYTDGIWEPASLTYFGSNVQVIASGNDDGAVVTDNRVYNYEAVADLAGDWAITNGWYDALSSVHDWTNIYPGWSTHSGETDAIKNDSIIAQAGEGDIITLGNAGSVPMTDVTMSIFAETADHEEDHEATDGWYDTDQSGEADTPGSGGDRVDPFADSEWQTAGVSYNQDLATQLYVQVERVYADGSSAEVYSGLLSEVMAGDPVSVTTGQALESNEVMYLRFNWEMDSQADDTYANQGFDFQVAFNATT